MAERHPKIEDKSHAERIEVHHDNLEHLKAERSKEAQEAAEKHSSEKLKTAEHAEKAKEQAEKAPKVEKKAEKKPVSATRGVKKQEYKATMRRVESRLPVYQRAFSKVIHNPAVDAVSNVTSKTIARPSGLLGGAVAAFIGLTIVYVNARRIGFEYPSGTAFIYFIIGGWLAGIAVEYVYGAAKKVIGK